MECAICLERMAWQVVALPCAHRFHSACIRRHEAAALERPDGPGCPCCRAPFRLRRPWYERAWSALGARGGASSSDAPGLREFPLLMTELLWSMGAVVALHDAFADQTARDLGDAGFMLRRSVDMFGDEDHTETARRYSEQILQCTRAYTAGYHADLETIRSCAGNSRSWRRVTAAANRIVLRSVDEHRHRIAVILELSRAPGLRMDFIEMLTDTCNQLNSATVDSMDALSIIT